eukprot:2627207-Rhodomonas_salina.2
MTRPVQRGGKSLLMRCHFSQPPLRTHTRHTVERGRWEQGSTTPPHCQAGTEPRASLLHPHGELES